MVILQLFEQVGNEQFSDDESVGFFEHHRKMYGRILISKCSQGNSLCEHMLLWDLGCLDN